MKYYIMNKDRTLQSVDQFTCEDWWNQNRIFCCIGKDYIIEYNVLIVTTFLGVDFGNGPFETMLFHNEDGIFQYRTRTVYDAGQAHIGTLRRVREQLGYYEKEA